MRPSASLCQTSRYRLLTLLLVVLLLGYIGTHTVNGSPISLGNFSELKSVKGGTSFRRGYYLYSECSEQYVQMKLGRKPLNARGSERTRKGPNKFTLLVFESLEQGKIRIKGNYSGKYICFSRRGRLILRNNAADIKCHWKEIPDSGFIKLQSVANEAWFMGFNRRGRKMWGHKHSKMQRNKRKKCFYFSKKPHGSPLRHQDNNSYSPFKSSDFKDIVEKPRRTKPRKLRRNRRKHRKNR